MDSNGHRNIYITISIFRKESYATIYIERENEHCYIQGYHQQQFELFIKNYTHPPKTCQFEFFKLCIEVSKSNEYSDFYKFLACIDSWNKQRITNVVIWKSSQKDSIMETLAHACKQIQIFDFIYSSSIVSYFDKKLSNNTISAQDFIIHCNSYTNTISCIGKHTKHLDYYHIKQFEQWAQKIAQNNSACIQIYIYIQTLSIQDFEQLHTMVSNSFSNTKYIFEYLYNISNADSTIIEHIKNRGYTITSVANAHKALETIYPYPTLENSNTYKKQKISPIRIEQNNSFALEEAGYFQKALVNRLQKYISHPDDETAHNLAESLINCGLPDIAYEYEAFASNIFEKDRYTIGIIKAFGNLGRIYRLRKNYKAALSLHSQELELAYTNNKNDEISESHWNQAIIYRHQKWYTNAWMHARLGMISATDARWYASCAVEASFNMYLAGYCSAHDAYAEIQKHVHILEHSFALGYYYGALYTICLQVVLSKKLKANLTYQNILQHAANNNFTIVFQEIEILNEAKILHRIPNQTIKPPATLHIHATENLPAIDFIPEIQLSLQGNILSANNEFWNTCVQWFKQYKLSNPSLSIISIDVRDSSIDKDNSGFMYFMTELFEFAHNHINTELIVMIDNEDKEIIDWTLWHITARICIVTIQVFKDNSIVIEYTITNKTKNMPLIDSFFICQEIITNYNVIDNTSLLYKNSNKMFNDVWNRILELFEQIQEYKLKKEITLHSRILSTIAEQLANEYIIPKRDYHTAYIYFELARKLLQNYNTTQINKNLLLASYCCQHYTFGNTNTHNLTNLMSECSNTLYIKRAEQILKELTIDIDTKENKTEQKIKNKNYELPPCTINEELYNTISENNIQQFADCIMDVQNINEIHPKYDTLLIHAVRNNAFEITKILVAIGADTIICDVHGNTPYTIACNNNFVEIKELFETCVNKL